MIGSDSKRNFGPFAEPALSGVEVLRVTTVLRLSAVLSVCLIAGCASPEAGRASGSPGADVKNWGSPVELHAGAQPYHDTPCVTERVECHGPPPVFGATPPPD
jgi:hypothetical protein